MLDLDALEAEVKSNTYMDGTADGKATMYVSPNEILALIEQLRKAEIDLEASHEREMALSIRTARAEAALQEKQDELDVAYGKGSGYSEGEQRWFSALDKANARIAQLELVRSAAMLLLRTGTSSYATDPKYWIGVTVQTFAALDAAVEEG